MTVGLAPGLVLQGQVELPPQATELLSSPLAGVVQQVLVAPGQRVRAGEVVARLTSPELLVWQRELLQAQSQARLAASRLARDEQLYAEGTIPGLRLQDSRAASEQAQLALQERRQALQALIATADVFMHTWDLAHATGQDERLDPDFSAELLAGMESMEDVLRDFDSDYRQLRRRVMHYVVRQPKMIEPVIKVMSKARNYIRKLFAPFNI